MQHSSALYHLDVFVPAISKGNNTSTWLTLSKHSVDRASNVIARHQVPKQSLKAIVRLLPPINRGRNDQVFSKMLLPRRVSKGLVDLSTVVTGVTMLQLPGDPILQDGVCHIAKQSTVAFMPPTPLAGRQDSSGWLLARVTLPPMNRGVSSACLWESLFRLDKKAFGLKPHEE